jgi:hypothetical protein
MVQILSGKQQDKHTCKRKEIRWQFLRRLYKTRMWVSYTRFYCERNPEGSDETYSSVKICDAIYKELRFSLYFNGHQFLCAFTKLRKATIRFVISVCPSVYLPVCTSLYLPAWNNSEEFYDMWYVSIFRKYINNNIQKKCIRFCLNWQIKEAK